VNWKEWGLLDYPKVVKTPMDLGTVKKKLDGGAYAHPREFKHDVCLVFTNCMTYNADGSEYFNMASSLKKIFEERYAKTVKDEEEGPPDNARPPTLVDKKMFSQNLYNISSEDLGKVVQLLDQRCEACIKKIDPEDLEIDIDAIDHASFWAAGAYGCEGREAALLGARERARARARDGERTHSDDEKQSALGLIPAARRGTTKHHFSSL
jgi:hypothetical protein